MKKQWRSMFWVWGLGFRVWNEKMVQNFKSVMVLGIILDLRKGMSPFPDYFNDFIAQFIANISVQAWDG